MKYFDFVFLKRFTQQFYWDLYLHQFTWFLVLSDYMTVNKLVCWYGYLFSNGYMRLFKRRSAVAISKSPTISIVSYWCTWSLRMLLIVSINSLSIWVGSLHVHKNIHLRFSWWDFIAIISKSDSKVELFNSIQGMLHLYKASTLQQICYNQI